MSSVPHSTHSKCGRGGSQFKPKSLIIRKTIIAAYYKAARLAAAKKEQKELEEQEQLCINNKIAELEIHAIEVAKAKRLEEER